MSTLLRNMLVTGLAVVALYWLIGLYDSALRDPRFLDGWLLFAGMGGQLLLHLRKKAPAMALGQVACWMRAHVYGGYAVIALFAVHTSFSLPDSPFEWILWALFVLVAVSGVIGAYLSWSVPAKLEKGAEQISFERIPAFRFTLARQVGDLAVASVEQAGSLAISDFYVNRLYGFFRRPRNFLAHLRGSRRPLRRLCEEIDGLERYIDASDKDTLRSIKRLVVMKDNLDFQFAHMGVLQTWLFIHIPATYSLIALSILHVAVVYAFSAGVP